MFENASHSKKQKTFDFVSWQIKKKLKLCLSSQQNEKADRDLKHAGQILKLFISVRFKQINKLHYFIITRDSSSSHRSQTMCSVQLVSDQSVLLIHYHSKCLPEYFL